MLDSGRPCGCVWTATRWAPLLALVLLCLHPEGVSCHVRCAESGWCPGDYLCCYNRRCCPLAERAAELAGAVSGVFLLFAGLAFCCIRCCRTRRQYVSNPAVRAAAAVPTPAPPAGGGGDHFSEVSPLVHDQRATYGTNQDTS